MLVVCFGILFVLSFVPVREAELVKTCQPDEFPCDDGSCVKMIKWCDTREDCADDSDEKYCHLRSALRRNPNRCNETIYFLCDDGQCIPAVGRCDGFPSCYDKSDEENCGFSETVLDSTISTTKADGLSIPLSGNDSNVFGNLYVPNNSMQSDHVYHSDIETVNKSIIYSTGVSDTSEQKPMDKVLQENVSLNIVSNNETHKDLNLVLTNRSQPLEFRDISGGMLNISRNKQNATTIDLEPLSSLSINKNYTPELVTKHKTKVPLDVYNNQNESGDIRNRHLHAKVPSPQESMNKELDLHKGYVKLQTRDFRKSKEKALQWLIQNRDKDYGWGDETARALITLWMADYSTEKSGDMSALMSKQLHLKLFTLMSRNETESIPLGELALYINALSASCDNPRNFHGHDLITILRHRTNAAQESAKRVTPFVYLVLCLNNELSDVDVVKVRGMIYDLNMTKTDTEAVVSLTAICMSRTHKYSNTGLEEMAARRLLIKISALGLPRNIYELALLTQVLNEAKINQDLWNRSEAMRRITDLQEEDGSFGDILATYYTMPTLCGKSFMWIGKNCPLQDEGLAPVEVLKNGENEKMYIHYSLRFGNPIQMSQCLMIKVQKNTSFMDIMRIAATINPMYRFKYDVNEGKPSVYSIGGIGNDAERGLYWTPYTSRNSTKELVPFEGDIRNFIPRLEEYIAFWRKSIF